MKTCFTFLVLLLALGRSFGQQLPVTGRVVDAQRQALPFAAVLLLAASDSVVADVTRADAQGAYEIKAKRAGQYLVTATAVGFGKDRSGVFVVGGSSVRLPDLVMAAATQEWKCWAARHCWKCRPAK